MKAYYMCKYFVFILSVLQLCLLTSCKSDSPTITAECSLNKLHSYHIKWEVYPHIDGEVAIYMSNSPYCFDTKKKPNATANIADGSAVVITDNSTVRHYFLLKFNNTHSYVVATRTQNIGNVENFRDIGGYKSKDGKHIKWGMLFRSGEFTHINNMGTQRMKRLKIRNCYSFASEQNPIQFPTKLDFIKNHDIPFKEYYYNDIKNKVVNNKLRRGDAIVFMQDMNINFVEESKEALITLFQQIVIEENYPLVITSQYGKDYTGFAVAMIQHVLDIPEKYIYEDYLLSNRYLNKVSSKTEIITNAPTSTQEAVTALLSADKKYLGVALSSIIKKYGSVDNYLTNEIGVTDDMRKQLKKILLY